MSALFPQWPQPRLGLRDEPVFSAFFVAHLLTRNIRLEEDLADQMTRKEDNYGR